MELFAGFDAVQIAIAILATLGAAFIRGLTGFGFGILLVPVLALALTPIEAVLAINIMAGLLALTEIRLIVREAERSFLTISALVIVGTPIGLLALAATPPALARLLIAIVALSAFVAVLLPPRPSTRPGPAITLATGFSAGLLTGFAAMPGPPVIPYYVGRGLERRMAKASMIGIFGVAAIAGLASGAGLGVLDWRLLALGLALFPIVLLGNYLGSLAFGTVSDTAWRICVAVILGAAALAACVRLL